jgi:2-dehydropantoate 2-reductase
MLHDVGFKVRHNTSSMLQDVLAGKKTEIRDFNGWLVDTASWLDERLDVSGHKKLIELVETGVSGNPEILGKYFPCISIRLQYSG